VTICQYIAHLFFIAADFIIEDRKFVNIYNVMYNMQNHLIFSLHFLNLC